NRQQLAASLGVPVLVVSSRSGEGLEELPAVIENLLRLKQNPPSDFELTSHEVQLARAIEAVYPVEGPYQALLIAHHHKWLPFLSEEKRQSIAQIVDQHQFNS